MERSFLRYLLTTDPQLRALGAENKISVILVSIYNDTRFTVILYFPFFFPLIDLTASVPPLPHPPHSPSPPPAAAAAAAAFPDSFSFSSSLSTSFSSSSRPLLHLLLIQSAYGFVQNSFSEVCAIQQKIDEFVSSSIPSHLVFILGVTNHWVTLLAYKTSALPSFSSARPSCHQSSSNSIISSPNLSSCSSTVTHTVNGCCVSKVTTACHCSDKSVENDGGTLTTSIRTGVIYMDSNNVPVVGYTDNDIDAHLLKQEEERIKVKGKEYLSWKRETYRQAYKDQRELVRMLTSCVSGHGNLCEYVITDCISRLINSYNSCVEQRLSELADSDLFLPLLLDWLQSHYPPKSITELLQPLLEWGGQSAVLDPLRNWAEHVYALVLSLETSGLEAVDQFEQILSQVTCKLRLE